MENLREDDINKYTTVQVNKKTAKLLKALSAIQGENIRNILNDLVDKEVSKFIKEEKEDVEKFRKGEKYIRDKHGNILTLNEIEKNMNNVFLR